MSVNEGRVCNRETSTKTSSFFKYKVSISETKPRTAVFQKNRNNVPPESVSDYFRKVVTIPLLDHLLTQLNLRFDGASVMVYGGSSKYAFVVS